MPSPFYQPAGSWVGDVIPWQEDGTFHLFYLHETRNTPRTGMPWHEIRTRDLVRMQDMGEVLPSGGPGALDFNAYTGSIVRDEAGVHHLFYTGQNPHNLGADGLPRQLVMHATSSDNMNTWQRQPEHTFGASAGYETGDWRDPYVFRDEEAGLWRMLITARHRSGPTRRRGVIAQCVSNDLSTWNAVDPFWAPRRYVALECPEVFRWGQWWYLVYSEFSESFATRYRMAASLEGPWIVPDHDTIDGRAFYAAKSAERDGRRFFFGWIATREGESDDGPWEWAGTMATVEARQRPEGTLAFSPTQEALEVFALQQDIGISGLPIRLSAPDSYRAVVSRAPAPATCRISARFTVNGDTTEIGLLLRASADGDEGYALRLEPRRRRMVLDRWPRRQTGREQWQISGDVPHLVELERPADLGPGQHRIEVLLDGTICVASLDDAVVLSARLYDRPQGHLGIFVGEGEVLVDAISVFTADGLPTAASPIERVLPVSHT